MGACQGTNKKKSKLQIDIPNQPNSDQGRNASQTQSKSAQFEKKTPLSSKRQSLKTSQLQQNSASSDSINKARKSTPLADLQGLNSDKVRTTKHKLTLKMNATIKKAPFSKFYSVQQSKKSSFSKIAGGSIIVQHNVTGKLHYADILDNSVESQFYINELLRCQISHPNITNVVEILEDKSEYIVIKEYCQGLPVSYFEPIEKQLSILKQIIEAIQYLHSKNLIHGGLWLGAFERNNNVVKLVDLKSIFIRHEPTHYDIEYLAPECLLDSTIYNIQRDIWAVGMMAHNLLNGRFYKVQNFSDISKEIEQLRIKKHIHLEQQNKEFLEKFLHITPEKRILLCDAIQDKFLPQISENQIIEFQNIFERNVKLKTISVIQQCILLLFINQFQEQKLKLQQIFLDLDQDHDNKITKKDFLDLLPDAETQINFLFDLISVKDKMDFQEFLIIAVNKEQLLTSDNIETIFNLYSTNKKFILMTNLINIYKQRQKEIEQEFQDLEHPHLNFKNFESLVQQLI